MTILGRFGSLVTDDFRDTRLATFIRFFASSAHQDYNVYLVNARQSLLSDACDSFVEVETDFKMYASQVVSAPGHVPSFLRFAFYL